MAKKKKTEAPAAGLAESRPKADERDEIDFPTVVWSLVILAVLVILHRLIWGG